MGLHSHYGFLLLFTLIADLCLQSEAMMRTPFFVGTLDPVHLQYLSAEGPKQLDSIRPVQINLHERLGFGLSATSPVFLQYLKKTRVLHMAFLPPVNPQDGLMKQLELVKKQVNPHGIEATILNREIVDAKDPSLILNFEPYTRVLMVTFDVMDSDWAIWKAHYVETSGRRPWDWAIARAHWDMQEHTIMIRTAPLGTQQDFYDFLSNEDGAKRPKKGVEKPGGRFDSLLTYANEHIWKAVVVDFPEVKVPAKCTSRTWEDLQDEVEVLAGDLVILSKKLAEAKLKLFLVSSTDHRTPVEPAEKSNDSICENRTLDLFKRKRISGGTLIKRLIEKKNIKYEAIFSFNQQMVVGVETFLWKANHLQSVRKATNLDPDEIAFLTHDYASFLEAMSGRYMSLYSGSGEGIDISPQNLPHDIKRYRRYIVPRIDQLPEAIVDPPSASTTAAARRPSPSYKSLTRRSSPSYKPSTRRLSPSYKPPSRGGFSSYKSPSRK